MPVFYYIQYAMSRPGKVDISRKTDGDNDDDDDVVYFSDGQIFSNV